MKTVKFFKLKLITLTTILFLCIAMLISFGGVSKVSAEASPSKKNTYFNCSTTTSFNAEGLLINVEEESTLEICNKLAIDDLGLSLKLDSNVDYIKLVITSQSYDVNGNKVADGEFNTEVLNVVEINFDSTNSFKLNKEEAVNFELTGSLDVKVNVVNGVMSVQVENAQKTNSDVQYKVKNLGGIATGNLSFAFGIVEGATDVRATLLSIDQKTADAEGKFRQELATETVEGIEQFKGGKIALPRVTFKDSLINSNNQFTVKNGHRNDLTYNIYSVFGDYQNSDLTINKVEESNEDIGLDISPDESKFTLNNNTSNDYVAINVMCDEKVVETYNIYTRKNDNQAPKYITTDTSALESFKKALLDATKKDYDEDGTLESVRVGGTIEIPSMFNLVTDDTPYELLSHTIMLTTPGQATASVSSWTIDVDKAGEYMFYVVFEDDYGNSMDNDDFVSENEDDSNVLDYGIYKDYIFTFTIEDNAPIGVTTVNQGKAYLNVRYSATPFDIQTSGYMSAYSLYYNANPDATIDDEGWFLIPRYKNLDKYYNESGWTYQDLVDLNYDDMLDFTPVKKGAYRIDCTVSSTSSVRYEIGRSIIKVVDEPNVVVVPSTWLKDNALSVVFLSVGTLCLVGIIALLFVKPKQKISSDEE